MEAIFSAPVQTGHGAHPASCTMGTGSFPEVKSGRGVTLTPHHLLVPWSRKSRGKPLLPLWALRPVQSLSACTRAHFTYLFYQSGIHKFQAASSSPYISYGDTYHIQHYNCDENQFIFTKHTATDNREIHRSLHNCGLSVWNLVFVTLLTPKN